MKSNDASPSLDFTSPEAVARYVEAHFGTDKAFGIGYVNAETQERISLEQGTEMYQALREKCPDLISVFPDGSSATICTNYALHIRARLPQQTHIVGFQNSQNPTSRCAREEFHPEGHDFAILAGRYLVDPWVRLVSMTSERIFYDLSNPEDAAEVLDIYGPQSCWKELYGPQSPPIRSVDIG
ncbi:hypothetical protein [Paraburkholderia sp. J8-2]|uniref:hypothetical protein n=1 Tax=Paraburkholderia sp. J8-2 TaxID=2805440 RepID=UPI002AB783D9|nr:hypothetical protein [Paraburkholderia sp. J8-2]